MSLYKTPKPMVHSPDSNADFFDIVSRVLLGDKLALFFM